MAMGKVLNYICILFMSTLEKEPSVNTFIQAVLYSYVSAPFEGPTIDLISYVFIFYFSDHSFE